MSSAEIFRSYLQGNSLTARAVRGTVLSGGGLFIKNMIRLAGNLVLTRLLFPEAFGVMALVGVVVSGLQMFSDLGIRASIIQDKRDDPAFLNTAWTVQIGRGIVLWAATWATAAPLAAFYEEPLLAQLLPVAGATAFIDGFRSTKIASLNRELLLGRITMMNIGSQIFSLSATIALALMLNSVWALVLGGMVGSVAGVIISHTFLPGIRNRITFDKDALSRLFGFGKYIFIATVAGYLVNHADRAILGKLVSLSDVAFYNIALTLAMLPLVYLRKIASSVLFPVYRARPPNASEKNLRKITASRRWLNLTTLIPAAILAIGGETIIEVLYDPRYHDAGPMLVLLAIAQMPILLTATYGPLPMAMGEAGRFAFLTIASAALRTTGLFFGGLWFGIVGVILTPLFATIAFYPIQTVMMRRYGAWTPVQDAAISLLMGLIAAIALVVNPGARAMIGL